MHNKKIIGLTLFLIGFVLVVDSNITGAVISINLVGSSWSLVGLIFVLIGGLVFAMNNSDKNGLEKITLSSAIKKNKSLLRLTKAAVRDQSIEKDLNHLIKELSKGNFESGKGHPGHIKGTDIFYLRGQEGGRLYYHKIGKNNYEIVAKSSKGRNQKQVRKKLEEVYKN